MTPQRLWAEIEPAPAPARRVRRRPSRTQIRWAHVLADVLHGALEPDLVAQEMGIRAPEVGDIQVQGRTVWLEMGPRKFVIVVRCVQ